MSLFKSGQRVQVVDEGLMRLNQIMKISEDDATNNKGVIASDEEGQDLYGNATLLVNFDDGIAAPYAVNQLIPLETNAAFGITEDA